MGLKIDTTKRYAGLLWFTIILGLLLLTTGFFIARWYATGERPPLIAYTLADPSIDETEIPQEEIDSYSVPPYQPKYLAIPSQNISKVRVMAMGLTEDNALAAPQNINDTAWYNESGTPGSGEAILINGHNGGYVRDGVFAELRLLEVGDTIELIRGDDELFQYEVREIESMPLDEVNKTGMKNMLASAEAGKEGLNIITCDGNWVPRLHQFDRRIMLRAVRIG